MKNKEIISYTESLPGPAKTEFENLWMAISSLIPEAEELICYGLPTLRLRKKNVIHAGAWKNHIALYPGAAAVKKFSDHPDCSDHSKGSIRFTYGSEKLIPLALQLVEFRVREIAG